MRQLVLTAATNVNELNTTIKIAAGGELNHLCQWKSVCESLKQAQIYEEIMF